MTKSGCRAIVTTGALLLAGCSNGLAPFAVVGTWASADPLPAFGNLVPDTLVLDGAGGGRVAFQWLREIPGGTPAYVVEWARAPLEYRMSGDAVLLRWCASAALRYIACAPGYHSRGTLDRDGTLLVGPTSLASSMSERPWVRVRD